MTEFITTAILGIFISILGIINMTGNISSLHWSHRQRITEENRKPFGRLVGIGTLIIGIVMIIFGALFFAYEYTRLMPLFVIGLTFLLVGFVAGIGISFYAMIKYNKGIF